MFGKVEMSADGRMLLDRNMYSYCLEGITAMVYMSVLASAAVSW